MDAKKRFHLTSNKERTTGQLQKAKDILSNKLNNHQSQTKYIQRFALETKINQCSLNDSIAAEEISEMFHTLGQNISCDKKSSDLSKTNLNLIEGLAGASVLSSESRITEVTENNECIREWEVQIVPYSKVPNVIIHQKFLTKETSSDENKLPAILDLELELVGLDTNELDGVMNNCREWREIQLFTRIVKEFMELNEARMAVLEKVKKGDEDLYEIKDNVVTFRSEGGDILALFSMPLEFNYRIMGWIRGSQENKILWQCKFTEQGAAAAKNMNFPPGVFENGTTRDWTAFEAISNFMKLASLSTENPTPDKTPIRSGLAGRVDKRKLEL